MENTTEYLLRRASEESLKAIASDHPAVSDAHEELAVRYSVKAATALAEPDEPTTKSGHHWDPLRMEPGADPSAASAFEHEAQDESH